MNLTIDCYKEFIDIQYTPETSFQELAKHKIIGANPEDIKTLFLMLGSLGSNQKWVVVSYESDFGVCYQSEEHPNKDLGKCALSMDYNLLAQQQEYQIPHLLTINTEPHSCKPTDKFSIKMNRWTHSTFNRIPQNVTWFTTNCNINEPNVHFIPFGVNKQGEGKNLVDKYRKPKSEKKKKLYVNFQPNTVARAQLLQYYKQLAANKDNESWLTFQEKNLLIEPFYEELSDHLYVLVPEGNGLGDSFRFYETLKVNSIPIMTDNRFSRNVANAGYTDITLYNNLYLDKNTILYYASKDSLEENLYDEKLLTKEYWGQKIMEAAK